MVRNSDELCKIINEKNGIKKLINICLNDHNENIIDMSLFSLGNISSYNDMKIIVKRDYVYNLFDYYYIFIAKIHRLVEKNDTSKVFGKYKQNKKEIGNII